MSRGPRRAARALAAVAVPALSAACMALRPDHGELCDGGAERIRPLVVGDTARLRGARYRAHPVAPGDCDPTWFPTLAWRSADSGVVRVDGRGLARGVAPGAFSAVGRRGRDSLVLRGFVLARGWRLQVTPSVARLRVGDSVTLRAVALAPDGGPATALAFQVSSPEALARDSAFRHALAGHGPFPPPELPASRLLDDHRWYAAGGDVVTLAARDTGATTLTVDAAERRATVRVVVVPAGARGPRR